MHQVIPSILAKTQKELEEMIRTYEPHVDTVHLDIMDGKFVPNVTIEGYKELDAIRTDLKFDIHLMIDDPYAQMFNWYPVGGTNHFCVHAEARNGLEDLIGQVKLNDKKVCLVLNPQTRLEDVFDLINTVDMVQIMTVEPGSYGGKFLDEVVYKISDFRQRFPEMTIAVDGGMNPDTAKTVLRAGASVLIVGNYIRNSKNVKEAIDAMRIL